MINEKIDNYEELMQEYIDTKKQYKICRAIWVMAGRPHDYRYMQYYNNYSHAVYLRDLLGIDEEL